LMLVTLLKDWAAPPLTVVPASPATVKVPGAGSLMSMALLPLSPVMASNPVGGFRMAMTLPDRSVRSSSTSTHNVLREFALRRFCMDAVPPSGKREGRRAVGSSIASGYLLGSTYDHMEHSIT